jgi:hypothetical protein
MKALATQRDPKRSAGEKSRFLHFHVTVNSSL